MVNSWPSCCMTMPGRSCVALTLLIVFCGHRAAGCSLERLRISEIQAGQERGRIRNDSRHAEGKCAFSANAQYKGPHSSRSIVDFPEKNPLGKEAQILRSRREIFQVRENAEYIGAREAEPLCQRGAVLIDRSGGIPAALADGVIRPAQCEIWEFAG